MYETNHTIVALSSPPVSPDSSGSREPGVGSEALVRISGPETFSILESIFQGDIGEAGSSEGRGEASLVERKSRIYLGKLRIEEQLEIDAKVYAFAGPNSYNGDDLVELHILTNPSVVEEVIRRVKAAGARGAGPGEFTARAYLNGKMDLTQAEAVAEVVASSNKFQLAAAEKLLGGKLSQTVRQLRAELLEVMSLIEAGLDFAEEDMEFISKAEAARAIDKTRLRLEALLANRIQYEEMVELPPVAIAGATNAGKSRLLNALLGGERSIVSASRDTTRDILTGVLKLEKYDCLLFDCAGLKRNSNNILDELAQAAAMEAIRTACLVVLCIDVAKKNYNKPSPSDELGEDEEIIEMIRPSLKKLGEQSQVLTVATKCDLLDEAQLEKKMARLEKMVGDKLIKTSAKTGEGIESLRGLIDKALSKLRPGGSESEGQFAVMERHKQVVSEALDSTCQAIEELKLNNEEVAAMLLRAAYQALGPIETERVEEAILEQIFSRFCIGK